MTTKQTTQLTDTEIRAEVRNRYGQIAAEFTPKSSASCCGPSSSSAASCCGSDEAEITQVARLYDAPDVHDLPEDVTGMSLGCGDPITLASLQPGQTVIDLGSGGGIDCFLAAKRVGETGQVIGVDMTAEMLEKARANQAKIGADNVEFRLGEIEHLPIADNTADVIISNCVINLSTDKPQVFREAFRTLRPGGRLAVSDIVSNGPLPAQIKASLSAWAGCIAGALDVDEYVAGIEAAGFIDVKVKPVYMDRALIDEAAEQMGLSEAAAALPEDVLYKSVFSAQISARKP